MKSRDIRHFFQELDKRISFPMEVILTGGAAAVLYGVMRITQDIDFEVHIKPKGKGDADKWASLQKCLLEVAQLTSITPQYAEDIDRWSSIALPITKTRFYEKIGKIQIRILDPQSWAVGKLTRLLQTDKTDLITVLKKNKTTPESAVQFWGKALGISPSSSAQDQFRRHVEYFLDKYAEEVWGKRVNIAKLKNLFLSSARSAQARKKSS